MNKQKVLAIIYNHLTEIKNFGVKRLALFGSFARDEQRFNSDLDFLVELNVKSFDAYMDLKLYLESLFNRPVDLVLSNTLKPRLRNKILKELVDAA